NNDLTRGKDLLDAQLQASVNSYNSAIRLVNAEAAKNFGGEIGQAKAQQVIAGLESAKQDKIQQWRDKQVELGIQKQQVAIAGGPLALAQRQEKFNEGLQLGNFTQHLNEYIAERADKALKLGVNPELVIPNTGAGPMGVSVGTNKTVVEKATEKKVGYE